MSLLTPLLLRLVPVHRLPAQPTPPAHPAHFVLHFARQVKGPFILLFFLNIATSFLIAIAPLVLKHIIDALALTAPLSRTEALHHLGPLLGTYLGACLLLRFATAAAQNILRVTLMDSGLPNLISRQLYHYLLGHSLSFFSADFAGRLSQKVLTTGNEVQVILNAIFSSVLMVVVSFITALATLFTVSPLLAVPVLIWGVLYAVMATLFLPPVQRGAAKFSEGLGTVSGRVVDGISNILTVKLFARGPAEDADVLTAIQQQRATHIELQLAYFRFQTSSDFLNVTLIGSSLLLALWLWSQGQLSPGGVAMIVPLVVMLSQQGELAAVEVNHIFEAGGRMLSGIRALIKPYGVLDAEHAPTLGVTRGEIIFDNVTFAYGPNIRSILENFSLTIPPGQKVGIVGPSGCGKSTLGSLLLRFYDVTDGAIRIDGQDLRSVTQNSLRENIGMVTQDTSLLHRSVIQNLLLARPDATPEEVERATAFAHADAFIRQLADPDGRTGLDVPVGERGVKLSGGQRQRLAIARLILKNAPIFILDEATSALDSGVELAIQNNLETLMENKTVLAIAHRLSTLINLDRIIVLDHGRIVQDGPHKHLITQTDGLYHRLWQHQSGGFLPE